MQDSLPLHRYQRVKGRDSGPYDLNPCGDPSSQAKEMSKAAGPLSLGVDPAPGVPLWDSAAGGIAGPLALLGGWQDWGQPGEEWLQEAGTENWGGEWLRAQGGGMG